jgi:hypothetical protein
MVPRHAPKKAMAAQDESNGDGGHGEGGSREGQPWRLKTAPGTSEYTTHVEEKEGRKILVCTVGKTVLHYDARCIDDLHAMLKNAGDWVELGLAELEHNAKNNRSRVK